MIGYKPKFTQWHNISFDDETISYATKIIVLPERVKLKPRRKVVTMDKKEFEALAGSPKRFGKADPNSMSNRILRCMPTDGAVSVEEISKNKNTKGITEKQIKTLLSNLVNKKDKEGNTKAEVKHNDDHMPFYRQISQGE